ncbi:MAG TPA: lytic transglycosylase domain-containing protein [Kiritimatiellia bacterium]|mgnify:CR=1 FL=1|nr:lytic transglycosylase domain-containing protein [Kiritimatiellia bacterium]HPJ56309.1 lytic transglycosylase domain-containing protein [Kiritimatiellia bacterium]HPR67818.1 lytic transglycosylase domain-containing protein [Kiritimatiellia bacterium]HRX05722.1 lytic transglycosylase domain-containing protein [Kiritimatiellia bacterium]
MTVLRSIQAWSPMILAVLLPLGFGVFRPAPPAAPAAPTVPVRKAVDAGQAAARLVEAVIQIESGGDPLKVGRHGERGLMQIRAGTWRDVTARLYGAPLPFDRAFEPALNRRVGAAYLAQLQDRLLTRRSEWKSDERALLLAAYNAGPGRLRAARYTLERLPRSTRDYVERASALHDTLLEDSAQPVRRRLQAAL